MKRGFTIIELIVVITAISILVSIVGFGSAAMLNRSKNAEGISEITILEAALEKYYLENNEYPSAAQLAGGGDGRNLSAAQYNTIASTLRVNVNILNSGKYKFLPCANGSNLCCTINANGWCQIPASDDKYIVYLTRSSSDVSSNAARTFVSSSSSCTYTFLAPDVNVEEQKGYSAYFLAYFNPVEPNTAKQWRWYSSDHGKHTSFYGCLLNDYDDITTST